VYEEVVQEFSWLDLMVVAMDVHRWGGGGGGNLCATAVDTTGDSSFNHDSKKMAWMSDLNKKAWWMGEFRPNGSPELPTPMTIMPTTSFSSLGRHHRSSPI
jgi:hypothetical protein